MALIAKPLGGSLAALSCEGRSAACTPAPRRGRTWREFAELPRRCECQTCDGYTFGLRRSSSTNIFWCRRPNRKNRALLSLAIPTTSMPSAARRVHAAGCALICPGLTCDVTHFLAGVCFHVLCRHHTMIDPGAENRNVIGYLALRHKVSKQRRRRLDLDRWAMFPPQGILHGQQARGPAWKLHT